MTFNSPNDETKHLYIKPRSLIIFSSDIRFIWQHSIALRKLDRVEDNIFFRHRRISLTFRRIRNGECKCPYVQFCDSQKSLLTNVSSLDNFNIKLDTQNSQKGVPTEIEKKHVYDVYEKIAPHF